MSQAVKTLFLKSFYDGLLIFVLDLCGKCQCLVLSHTHTLLLLQCIEWFLLAPITEVLISAKEFWEVGVRIVTPLHTVCFR